MNVDFFFLLNQFHLCDEHEDKYEEMSLIEIRHEECFNLNMIDDYCWFLKRQQPAQD